MRRAVTYLIFSLIVMRWSVVYADHFSHLFEQASEAYENANFQEAIGLYEEIIDNGYESWEVYYNLGNAYYKQIDIGKAILNYERATRLLPDNEDIQYNLQLANLRVIDKIQSPPQFFFSKFVERIKNLFSIDSLSMIVLIAYIMTVVLIIIMMLVKLGSFRMMTKVITYVFVIVLILSSLLLYMKIHEMNHTRYGIILVPKVIVYSSPEENGTEIFSLHEGSKVKLTRAIDSWSQIRLTDGKTGWLKNDAFEII